MGRTYLYILIAACCTLWTSCTREDGPDGRRGEPYKLDFAVSTRAAATAGDEERMIRSLYVYVFSADGSADYFTQGGIDALDEYTIHEMDIYDEGEKRIYVIANPPAYIASELTASSSEGRLKSLVLSMQKVAHSMNDLPQNQDGINDPGNTGFPMGNVVTAYVQRTSASSSVRQVSLLTAADGLEIESIPLIRNLGKVSVSAYLKDGNTEPVTVTDMKIYNYTGDGLFVPVWQPGAEWTEATDPEGTSRYALWNPERLLDLDALSVKEETVITTATSVFTDSGAGAASTGYIGAEHNSAENTKTVCSFYLCQNSYGGKASTSEIQSGVADPVGNRTSKLLVSLSDGRSTEITVPYLRRNDHLTIRLGITQYTIEFHFSVWNLRMVTPEWSDEVN